MKSSAVSKKERKAAKKKRSEPDQPASDPLATVLGVMDSVPFEDAALASLFAPDKAVPRERAPEPPLPRARQLSDQDVLDGTLGDVPEEVARAEAEQEAAEAASKAKAKKVYPPADPAVEAEKLHRTVFVGGLPVMNKHAKLARHFAQYGKVESVRFRSMAFAGQVNDKMRKVSYITGSFNEKRETCNGYVVFADAASVPKAIEAEDGRDLFAPGFILRVDRAEEPTVKPKKSVFVGNLPFDVTEKQLREVFVQFGPLEYVRVVRDANTGLGRGFAYVCFEKRDAAAAAVKPVEPVTVNGRKVRIERCVDKGESLGRGKFKPAMKQAKKRPRPDGREGAAGGGRGGRGGRGGSFRGGGGGASRGGRGGGPPARRGGGQQQQQQQQPAPQKKQRQ